MTFALRSNMEKALVPLVLTAVGTLAFQCSKYVFFDYPSEVRIVRQSYQSEQNRTIASQTYCLKFLNAQKAAFARAVGRLNHLAGISRSMPLGRDKKALSAIHTKAFELAQEANGDYGTLLAFAPEGKYVTQVARDAAVGMAAADAALWKAIYRCSRQGMTPSEASACNVEIPDAEIDLSRALALDMGDRDSASFTESMLKLNQEFDRQQYEAKTSEMWRWFTASFAGLACSVIAYSLILFVSFGSVATPSKSRQAKIGTDRDGTRRRSYQKGKGLHDRISWGSSF